MIRRRVVISGGVQGVFFRASCQQEAARHRVAGWVSNRVDGAVEAVFEGSEAAVEQMIVWSRTGPPRATVDQVQIHTESPTGERGFQVR